ncbi:hypothetical protein R3I94_001543 [Phoxinus phoxinus]
METLVAFMSAADIKRQNLGKKRRTNIYEWKDRARKYLRDAGKPYVNRRGEQTRGKSPPKEGKVCKETCPRQCSSLTDQRKLQLFTEFYAVSYERQQAIILSGLEQHKVSRRRPRGPDTEITKRKYTFKYHVQQGGQRLAVCKLTFMSVFQLTNSRLQVIQEKLGSQSEGTEQVAKVRSPLEDFRGKHKNRPHSIHPAVREGIREHILSFPRQPNHYSRMKGDVEREYLSPDLNLLRMFRLYKENNPTSTAKFWLYRDLFKQQNLSFGQPRSDTCAKCDALFSKLTAATTDGERLKISAESELHHRKAEKAYTQLQADTEWAKANDDCHVICIDMQGVVFTPNLTHSNVYYQRQLANYNLCIQEMGTDDPPTMWLWHESIAHRGSIEVASCLLKWAETSFAPLVQAKERKLIIYSDRCCGQNNNWRVLNLMALLVSRGYFSQIEQKFMVSGHSFLPCDRSFATLDKRRKVSTLHTPSDVAEMIRGARQQHPFKVIEMKCADFRQLPDATLKRPPGFLITSMMWLKVTAADPWCVHTKGSHSLYEGWKTWLITKQRKNQPPPAPLFFTTYARAYNDPLPIKKEKHCDLMKMIAYMPAEAQEFYGTLECGE